MRHLPALTPTARAALACLALASTQPVTALDTFTGARPVYLASWFNGSVTEVHEFQFATDWQGWCNARAGSSCQAIAYWNVAGNWDGNAIPSPVAGDVRVPDGHTVRVGGFQSAYLGAIAADASAAVVSAAGTVEIGSFAQLSTPNGGINRLHMFAFSHLRSDGHISVQTLRTAGPISLHGSGTTTVNGWSSDGSFQAHVSGSHTLWLAGAAAAWANPTPQSTPGGSPWLLTLNPTATLVNSGTQTALSGSVMLQGTADLQTLPRFVNTGSLAGALDIGAVRFDNAGTVQVDDGARFSIGLVGQHSGRFVGAAGSTLSLGGFAGGHVFEAGSTLSTQGTVTVGRGTHRVRGSFSAAALNLGDNGSLRFDGVSPTLGSVTLLGGGFPTLVFDGAGNHHVQTLRVESGELRFNAGHNRVGQLQMQAGSVHAATPLTVAGGLQWQNGSLNGEIVVDAPITLLAGSRGFSGSLHQNASADWQAGGFANWGGAWTVAAGQALLAHGDFSASGGGSLSLESGAMFSKESSTGRLSMNVPVVSQQGMLRARAGTLVLAGGGSFGGGLLQADPGALIELGGPVTLGTGVAMVGDIDVRASRLTLLPGVSFASAAGRVFEPGSLVIASTAALDHAGALTLSGGVLNEGWLRVGGHFSMAGDFDNRGLFEPGGDVVIQGGFHQRGGFALAPGHALTVGGHLQLDQALLLQGGYLSAGTLTQRGDLRLTGNVFAYPGVVNITAGATLQIDSGASGQLGMGTLRVEGALNNEGAAVHVNVGATDLHGSARNAGSWDAYDRLTLHPGSRFDNLGSIGFEGQLTLHAGSVLANDGSLTLIDGALFLADGAELAGAGSYTQLAGASFVDGLLRADGGIFIDSGLLAGRGTLDGHLTLGPTALWTPGNSPGTMTVTGDVLLQGRLELEFVNPLMHDRVVVGGFFQADPGSAIQLGFAPSGWVPRDGDSFDWLRAAGGTNLAGASISVLGAPGGFHAVLDPASGRLDLFDPAAVPLPASGNHVIPAGQTAFSADRLGRDILNELTNQGLLSHRAGHQLTALRLVNEAGGEVLWRGEGSVSELLNQGSWTGFAGSRLSAGPITNAGSMDLAGAATAMNVFNQTGATLTLRSGATLESHFRIVNNGRLVIERDALLVSNEPWLAALQSDGFGSELVVDGQVRGATIQLSGSRLSGNGTLEGRVLANWSVIAPGHSVGRLSFLGDLEAGSSELEIELDGLGSFDQVFVSGSAQIGYLRFMLADGFRPTAGASFAALQVAGTLGVGGWAVWYRDAFGGVGFWGDAGGVPSDPTLALSFAGGTLSVVAVPEPATYAMWLGGLAAIGLWLRRRRPGREA